MPAASFLEYTKIITDRIDLLLASDQVRLEGLAIDQRSMLAGLISGILIFEDDSELHFREFVDLAKAEPVLMYAYHYQDADKNLKFRYDNAAHRPPLEQVEHKHTSDRVLPSLAPTFDQVIDEIIAG